MLAIPVCSLCAAYLAQQFLFAVYYIKRQILELPLSFTDDPKTSFMDDPKRIAGMRVAGRGGTGGKILEEPLGDDPSI